MEWYNILEIVVGCIGTVAGFVGGGVGIFYWKENKALKKKEVESMAIDNELKQADAWRSLFEKERERSQEKSDRLKCVYAELDDKKRCINDRDFRIQQLEWYHCTVNGCLKRRPPHKFDELGNEEMDKQE